MLGGLIKNIILGVLSYFGLKWEAEKRGEAESRAEATQGQWDSEKEANRVEGDIAAAQDEAKTAHENSSSSPDDVLGADEWNDH